VRLSRAHLFGRTTKRQPERGRSGSVPALSEVAFSDQVRPLGEQLLKMYFGP
jgi:hypothetical protein